MPWVMGVKEFSYAHWRQMSILNFIGITIRKYRKVGGLVRWYSVEYPTIEFRVSRGYNAGQFKKEMSMKCCCHSGLPHEKCCGPYLEGTAQAPSPEALMRSRYAAFVHENASHLARTRAEEFCRPDEILELAKNFSQTRWEGLAILGKGMETKDRGWVEFVAFYLTPGGRGQLHEKSKFVRRNGRWFYTEGTLLPPVIWGRNQVCWCGSGKKYKKCHGG